MNFNSIAFPVFADRKTLTNITALRESKLQQLRMSGEWLEGVHYVYLNPGKRASSILYNVPLCLNWLANRHEPDKHEKVITQYSKLLDQLSLGTFEVFAMQAHQDFELSK